MTSIFGVQVDVFIPSIQTAIEFDGSYYHSMHNTDYKYAKLMENGVRLLTLSGLKTDRPNTVSFNDTSIKLSTFPNALTIALSELFLKYLGVVVDFSDYLHQYGIACSTISRDSGRVVVTSQMRSMWSPLNGYDIEYLQNNSVDKLWLCSHGHTFLKRYDVVKKCGLSCPYCTGRGTFEFYCIGFDTENFIVLDIALADVEVVSKSLCLEYMRNGANIYGLTIECSTVHVDLLVYSKIGHTAFRKKFFRFKSRRFKAVGQNAVAFVAWLNRVFAEETIDSIHDRYFANIQRLNSHFK